MLRVYKNKNKFIRYFNEKFSVNSGIERFIIFILLTLFSYHLFACIW